MKRLALFYLHTSAAIASLVSLGAMLMLDRWQATLALITLVFFLAALLAVVYAALTRHMRNRYPDGYSRISTFARYTSDGKIVRYEAYRTIQCRQPLMSAFLHGYKWTGSGRPRITSTLQTVGTRSDGGASDYDCVGLAFPRPYGASEPHVEFRVHEPVELIVWRVGLRHVPRHYRKEARVTRRRIDARFNARPEHVAQVGFDAPVWGYQYHVTRPEPGYFYCLEWDR